ncbi:TetR family transcriptional regulator [Pseudomonas rhizophila]|jgi:AcrR family transcriptional regulator|uniref:TetR family transcriptional regulator n=2 Tax=Pseudomonas TaxID=286 RepID=A0ABN5JVB2_9PSED|nr:TetR family transcriptional regulator [Pseudomonas rhizophila]QKJ38510.1 TetR/AcrR family transcriptional regulator [Pseudomonas sp. MPDS]
MIVGAADLLRRKGLTATSMREVVRYSNTPRGSIAHHFPGGKRQLLEAAVEHAGREVTEPLKLLLHKYGPVNGMKRFVDLWRKILEESDYQAGCAVLAVSVEQYTSDQRGEAEPELEAQIQTQLLNQANAIFVQWREIIDSSLREAGVTKARSHSLALLAIAAIEGSVALCRAARSVEPLDLIWGEVKRSFERELT